VSDICNVLDGNTTSLPSSSRRRHSSVIPQESPAELKTATRRKAVSVDEVGPALPSKQPLVEISPLKLTSVTESTPTVVR